MTRNETLTKTMTKTACAGRERTCNQCGSTYRSPRNSSLYCGNACRQKAKRGAAPLSGPKAGPDNFTAIGKALVKTGFAGRVTSSSPHTYTLLLDTDTAHAELAYQFNRKGWGLVSREEFDAAIKRDGINTANTRSEHTLELNRFRARQRGRIARSSSASLACHV